MGRRPKPSPRQLDGVLVVDKPSGPSSAEVLTHIKRACGQPVIGHAGTLDPLASGVLVVLLGKATRLSNYVMDGWKTYSGTLLLGQTTDTYDIQGQVTAEAPWQQLGPEAVAQAVLDWNAITMQEVPAYSAAKHHGRPLYALARAGEQTPVKTKAVEIRGARATSLDLPQVGFELTCIAGTYVRSLVHSLGTRLGCGAIMTALRREASQPFSLHTAHTLDDILADPDGLAARVVPVREALAGWDMPQLTAEQAAKVRNGLRLPAPGAETGQRALLLDPEGQPLALAEAVNELKQGPEHGPELRSWAILRGMWSTP